MLAAFLILAFTAASLFRVHNRFLIPLFFLAGMTKEVAFPFLLVIGGLCLLPEIVTAPGKIKGRLYALLAGALLTVLVNVAFNYFRYGTYYDAGHLTELYLVPTLRLHLSFFLAMWFTPYGGLLFFWPSFVLLYFSLLVLLFIRWKNKSQDELSEEPAERLIYYLPIIIISLVLVLLRRVSRVGVRRSAALHGGRVTYFLGYRLSCCSCSTFMRARCGYFSR